MTRRLLLLALSLGLLTASLASRPAQESRPAYSRSGGYRR